MWWLQKLEMLYLAWNHRKLLVRVFFFQANGFQAIFFFQSNWAIIGKSIYEKVARVLKDGPLDTNLNNTPISLIPKVPKSITFKQFRPITLCTVIYKIITKVIANRLKYYIPILVGSNQTSFVPGRRITHNIIIA